MFEFSRNQKNAFSIEIIILYGNKEVYPQIDEPFDASVCAIARLPSFCGYTP